MTKSGFCLPSGDNTEAKIEIFFGFVAGAKKVVKRPVLGPFLGRKRAFSCQKRGDFDISVYKPTNGEICNLLIWD